MTANHRHRIPPELLARARELRRQQAPAEKMVWTCLRGRRLGKMKFRRQFPVGKYVADFCCPACRLIVELDGISHEGQEVYDAERAAWLESQGYCVMRFRNEDVYLHFERVLERILEKCEELSKT